MQGPRRRRRRKRERRFTSRMQKALLFVFAIVIIVFIALIFKIYMLNQGEGDRYKKSVLLQQPYINYTVKYKRGSIKDRNATTLALSKRVFNLVLEPRNILYDDKYYEPTVTALVDFFDLKREDVEKMIKDNPNSLYIPVNSKKGLSIAKRNKFKAKMNEKNSYITGVYFEEDYVRKYPLSSVGSDIIGFLSSEKEGIYGVESSYNEYLTGVDGSFNGYYNSDLKLEKTVKEAKDGDDVVLTIDANVQQLVEEQIEKFLQDTGAEHVGVVLMDPNNGEILAMASNGQYDLNNPRDLTVAYTQDELAQMDDKAKTTKLSELWSNYCVSTSYEPGSTFKPFTVAAALDEGTVTDASTFECKKKIKVGDKLIGCAHGAIHGHETLAQTLMNSCNVALTQIGLKLGRDKFSKYNQIFNFGSKTGIDLPGESAGVIHTKEQLNDVELATSSFGQTQNVTMVQMMASFCSLINGGKYYRPHVVKEIQNSNGAVVEKTASEPTKMTISDETSKLLKSYMLKTVQKGTATDAKVKGYEIAGKTGTAEKRPIEENNYLVSFIGFTPVENPQVAIYVVIDQPHVDDQAHSSYACKFASKVMKKVLPFLDVYQSK